jgi:hypothetical protein
LTDPKLAAATNFCPSAEQAVEIHGYAATLFEVQVAPESTEVYIAASLEAAAISLVPSADEETEDQLTDGAFLGCQVTPELVEV